MKLKYLNNLSEDSYSLFTRMKSSIRKAGLVALVGAIIGIGLYGCKKEEPLDKHSKIVFRSNRDGNWEIYVMNADGSGQKRLPNIAGSDWLPSWSPDGKKIAFQSYRDGNGEIYVMNADGSEQKRLTNSNGIRIRRSIRPFWSPFLSSESETKE